VRYKCRFGVLSLARCHHFANLSCTTPSFSRSPTTSACLSPYTHLSLLFHASGNLWTRFRPSHIIGSYGAASAIFKAMFFSPIRYFGGGKAFVMPMSTSNPILLLFPAINTVPPRPTLAFLVERNNSILWLQFVPSAVHVVAICHAFWGPMGGATAALYFVIKTRL
jgi:hypothetical protein